MLIPSPAPLPHPKPTTSYWQDPPSRLQNHRTTPSLPSEAEYIIIGGGISGSSLAYQLLYQNPGASVLLLEARDACSGASGRNGGHCRPGRYTTFLHDTSVWGLSEATRIARFEETNVRQLASFAQKHNINCTLEPLTTVDIYTSGTEHLHAQGLAAIAARKLALAEDIASGAADERIVYSAQEAKVKFLIPDAVGAVSFPAYSINPYQFVCGVLELALERGLNLQTGTPVEEIEREEDGKGWRVRTERGVVKGRHVLLATNGYTSHLLPQAAKFIMPVRNQAVALQPGARIARGPLLKDHSLCFVYDTKMGMEGHDYLVSKPHKSLSTTLEERDLVFGGGRHLAPNHEEFVTDDSSVNQDVARYLRGALGAKHFGRENWGEDGKTLREWTGIVGHTPDENPVLGSVPGQPGLWICAGFTGHGMALAFRSAEAVSGLVLGREDIEHWLPESFLCDRKGVGEVFGLRSNEVRRKND